MERVAAEEAASGIVRGAADGLREEMPDVDKKVRALIRDSLTALGRIAHEAATHENGPEETAHDMAAAAMRGALEELEREWQNGGFPLHGFVERLNQMLDRVSLYAANRANILANPDESAREISAGLVEGAAEKLHERAPRIVEDLRTLGPLAEELAYKAGRGLVSGVQSKASEDSEAFARFLHDAGRGLVKGLSSALEDELSRHPMPGAQQFGASAASIAEQAAAGIVRGAARELAAQLTPLKSAFAQTGGPRQVTRELTTGALEALGTKLKNPLVAAASAAGALLTLGLLTRRRR